MTDDNRDGGLPKLLDTIGAKTNALEKSASAFSKTMSGAFYQSMVSGKSFDDTLKSLGMRLSNMAVGAALKPIETMLNMGVSMAMKGVQTLAAGLTTGLIRGGMSMAGGASMAAATGAIKPFAAGGVIGTPTYFPLNGGGLGLAGEAGPEAIIPLSRGADGRLGVASQGGGGNITVNIATPDTESFRRSEVYVTGQIARAVARGQRGL